MLRDRPGQPGVGLGAILGLAGRAVPPQGCSANLETVGRPGGLTFSRKWTCERTNQTFPPLCLRGLSPSQGPFVSSSSMRSYLGSCPSWALATGGPQVCPACRTSSASASLEGAPPSPPFLPLCTSHQKNASFWPALVASTSSTRARFPAG